ncbi:hypothetical protein FIBSPDRAFT_837088 [Athelia psychrophila]|uniref:Nephrocystin 3-like N-terminal domain-containing protein n=1 Tax=Athelia psychrophila TaxID=1759441 RepID=A0A166ATF5_9AGAM|nr:hypothetical protein FIBSPDRAFT_837088 [Fibularhizoctonia sp. CBS 109695]
METIDDIHSFVLEAEPLRTIQSHRMIIENLSSLTVECAYLIRDYALDKNFWMRVANLTLLGVQSKIQEYQAKFKDLKTRLNERVNVSNAIALGRIDIKLMRCLNQVETTATNLILKELRYAADASYEPSKACLPGTRKDALDEIHRWINKADGDDTARLLVLTGVAGFGKSAIANSVAQHYATVNRLGSFFCFSRADQAGRHPGNILSTISRDIADLDPHWKAALCNVVETNHSLGTTGSTILQMKNFILEPAKALAIVGPVVVIIDALDECADGLGRASLLQALAQMAAELPPNFRILVTARPDTDIIKNFSEKSPHIQHKSIDRKIKTATDGATTDDATTDADLAIFIESQLAPVADALDEKWDRKKWLGMLVTGSGHLFQWAATTCRAILAEEGRCHSALHALNRDLQRPVAAPLC